jgi:hypothetical protein
MSLLYLAHRRYVLTEILLERRHVWGRHLSGEYGCSRHIIDIHAQAPISQITLPPSF